MSVLIDIADALVTALNDHDFTEDFTAVRKYLPEYEVSDLSGLTVTVVPKAMASVEATRSLTSFDVSIDVAVQQKIDISDNDDADGLEDLSDEIRTFIRDTGSVGDGQLISVEHVAPYSPEHMRQHGVYTSVDTFTFTVMA
jgi:hypothetical protein